jgi:hypothetical protein
VSKQNNVISKLLFTEQLLIKTGTDVDYSMLDSSVDVTGKGQRAGE